MNVNNIKNEKLSGYKYQALELNSKYILAIVAVYLTATLAADVVAYKFVTIGPLLESSATLIFPITYLLSDIITEVYGYSLARQVIWLNLLAELFFAIIIMWVVGLHSPSFFGKYQKSYETVFHHIFRFVLCGVVANVVSDFLNVYLISKWKVLVRGRHFWIRSILSTAIAEFLLCSITVYSAFTGAIEFSQVTHVFFSAYVLEIFYACIFVWPGWALIVYLKKKENLDAYDLNVNYNPFRISGKK